MTSNQFAIEEEDWVGFVLMTNGNETKDFILSIDFAKKTIYVSPHRKRRAGQKVFHRVRKKINGTWMHEVVKN